MPGHGMVVLATILGLGIEVNKTGSHLPLHFLFFTFIFSPTLITYPRELLFFESPFLFLLFLASMSEPSASDDSSDSHPSLAAAPSSSQGSQDGP